MGKWYSSWRYALKCVQKYLIHKIWMDSIEDEKVNEQMRTILKYFEYVENECTANVPSNVPPNKNVPWMYLECAIECTAECVAQIFFNLRSESTLTVDRKLFRNTQSTKFGLIHSKNQKKLRNIKYVENECTANVSRMCHRMFYSTKMCHECTANVPSNVTPILVVKRRSERKLPIQWKRSRNTKFAKLGLIHGKNQEKMTHLK